MGQRQVVLGFCVQPAGTAVVGLEQTGTGALWLVLSTLLAMAEPGDDLAAAPYAAAAGLPRLPEGGASPAAAAMVSEGRVRQDAATTAGLTAIVAGLGTGGGSRVALRGTLLVNRAGWVTDLLDYSLAYPEHAAVADGLARRDAVRAACARLAIPLVEADDKSLEVRAAALIGQEPAALAAALKTFGTTAPRPWRREQKRACLAAWCALIERAG